MGKKSDKKTKSKSGKAKLKSIGREKSIKKVLKKAEALLGEHGLKWADLPIAKHFVSEAEPEKQVAAPKRKAVPAKKSATKTPANAAAKVTVAKKPATSTRKTTIIKTASSVKKPVVRRTTKATATSKAPAARKAAVRKAPVATKTTTKRTATKKPATAKAAKLPPKYQNPANPSQTWAGRGPQPRWLKDYVAGGGTLEKALIKK